MGAVTESSSRKRMFSMQQTERRTAWNSIFTPDNSAREPRLFEHHEKKLRSLVTPVNPFKWHLQFESNGILQTSDHVAASERFHNELALITPCVPTCQRPQLRLFSPVPIILPAATSEGIKYREMKKAMILDNPWHLKLAYSQGLAENALDRVGRPRAGVRPRLRSSEALHQKYINTKRELDDYKSVVQAVNSSVPLNANGGRTLSPDLERLKQGGTNLQQGPRNLYYVQSPVARLSQNGTPWSQSGINLQNGENPSTPIFKEASNDKYISHDSNLTLRAIQVNNEVQVSDGQSEVNVTSNEKANHHNEESGSSVWRALLDKANNPTREARLESYSKEEELLEHQLARIRLGREETKDLREKERQAKKKEEVTEAFTPLSREEEAAVDDALHNGNRRETLVMHEETNIEVTRAIIQCLLPGAWLNDEVINVYMQLLKEREIREPNKFLKCHFFNTFFYNKLFKDKRSYDYKSVRRWTTQKKIGYSLVDCDKILVPIHQDIHWCLAVINFRDQRFEYLDSLNGHDENVLQVLARYIVDEAKDKGNEVPDVSKWERAFPDEIPEQLNGCDCGMFMVKYADFHGRGAPLSFTQEHMEYFRKRTVNEILQLEAK